MRTMDMRKTNCTLRGSLSPDPPGIVCGAQAMSCLQAAGKLIASWLTRSYKRKKFGARSSFPCSNLSEYGLCRNNNSSHFAQCPEELTSSSFTRLTELQPHYLRKMSIPTNSHHASPSDQRTLSTAATNGSNGCRTQSADNSTQYQNTNNDNSASAIARFLAEEPRDSPWNNISMLPNNGRKAI